MTPFPQRSDRFEPARTCRDSQIAPLFPRYRAVPGLHAPWPVWPIILFLAAFLAPTIVWAVAEEDQPSKSSPPYAGEQGNTFRRIPAKPFSDSGQWPTGESSSLSRRSPPGPLAPRNRSRTQVKRLSPKIKQRPVERLEALTPTNHSVAFPYIRRYGLLAPESNPKKIGGNLVGGTKEGMMYEAGDRVFLRLENRKDQAATYWYAFRRPQSIRHPDTHQLLGYLLPHTGQLRLKDQTLDNGLHTAVVEQAYAPIKTGNRVYPREKAGSPIQFLPKPAPPVEGQILRHTGPESLLGQGQMVALDLGTSAGLKRGHLLIIREKSQRTWASDKRPAAPAWGRKKGILMVVRLNEQMSFGLIVRNQLPVEAGDRVAGPEH